MVTFMVVPVGFEITTVLTTAKLYENLWFLRTFEPCFVC